jgi:RNA polymerase subunit RPABC4/transcription elongation factor Spt4
VRVRCRHCGRWTDEWYRACPYCQHDLTTGRPSLDLTVTRHEPAGHRCPYCAAEIRPGDAFCPACGSRLPTPTPVPAQSPDKSRPLRTSTAYAPGLERRAGRAELRPGLVAAYVAIVASLAVIVGSIGPWATVTAAFFGQIEVGGLSGDGKLTVWGGVIAGVLMLAVCANPRRAGFAVLAALSLLLVAGVGIYDWMNVSDAAREAEGQRFAAAVGVGWGLVLVTFGGVIGTVCAIVQAMQSPP